MTNSTSQIDITKDLLKLSSTASENSTKNKSTEKDSSFSNIINAANSKAKKTETNIIKKVIKSNTSSINQYTIKNNDNTAKSATYAKTDKEKTIQTNDLIETLQTTNEDYNSIEIKSNEIELKEVNQEIKSENETDNESEILLISDNKNIIKKETNKEIINPLEPQQISLDIEFVQDDDIDSDIKVEENTDKTTENNTTKTIKTFQDTDANEQNSKNENQNPEKTISLKTEKKDDIDTYKTIEIYDKQDETYDLQNENQYSKENSINANYKTENKSEIKNETNEKEDIKAVQENIKELYTKTKDKKDTEIKPIDIRTIDNKESKIVDIKTKTEPASISSEIEENTHTKHQTKNTNEKSISIKTNNVEEIEKLKNYELTSINNKTEKTEQKNNLESNKVIEFDDTTALKDIKIEENTTVETIKETKSLKDDNSFIQTISDKNIENDTENKPDFIEDDEILSIKKLAKKAKEIFKPKSISTIQKNNTKNEKDFDIEFISKNKDIDSSQDKITINSDDLNIGFDTKTISTNEQIVSIKDLISKNENTTKDIETINLENNNNNIELKTNNEFKSLSQNNTKEDFQENTQQEPQIKSEEIKTLSKDDKKEDVLVKDDSFEKRAYIKNMAQKMLKNITESGSLSVQDEVKRLSIEKNSVESIENNNIINFNFKKTSFENPISIKSDTINSNLNKHNILEQVTNEFSKIRTDIKGNQRLVMVLRPENLGRLQLDLTLSAKGLTANILAQNQDVKKYIEKNLNSLKTKLIDSGVNVSSIQIKTVGESSFTNLNFSKNNSSDNTFFNQNGGQQNNQNYNQNNHKQEQNNNEENLNNLFNNNYDTYFKKDFSGILSNSISYGTN